MADDSGTDKAIDPSIGRRIREIRMSRGLSQQALAHLAGFSNGYLSLIERGMKPVDRKPTQEAFARALEVHPSELTGAPWTFFGGYHEHAAITPLRLAITDIEFGDDLDTLPPEWPELQQQIDTMNALRPQADYAGIAGMMGGLLRGLHASLDGANRRLALEGLVDCYLAAECAAKNLGAVDLAQLAALRLRAATEQLSGPEWDALADYAKVIAVSSSARDRAYTVATKAANTLSAEMDRPEVGELYGMLHLTAALSSTIVGNMDQAKAHVQEADDIARRPGVGTVNFAHQGFSAGNVAIWRTTIAVETGEGGRAVKIAQGVDPDSLPESQSRRAAWYIDIGRGYGMERRPHEMTQAYRQARKLAPQRVQGNPWVRESVVDALGRARRSAGGRDLLGLAHWLKITA